MTDELENKIINLLNILTEERDLFSDKHKILRFLLDEGYLTDDILANNVKIEEYVKYYVKKYSKMPLKLLNDEYTSIRERMLENQEEDEKTSKIMRVIQDIPIILATAFIVGGTIDVDTIIRFIIVTAIFTPFFLLYLIITGNISMGLTRPVLQEVRLTNLVALLTMAFIIEENKG